jgi:hypothetical protein
MTLCHKLYVFDFIETMALVSSANSATVSQSLPSEGIYTITSVMYFIVGASVSELACA